MSTTNETDPQEERAKLWAEMDAGEGTPPLTPQASAAAADQPTDEAAKAAVAAPSESTAAETAAVEPGAADPYEGWPEAAKHAVLGMQSQMEQVLSRLRNAEGHIGGLNSVVKQQAAAKAAQATRNEGGDVPTSAQIRDAQADPEKMASLKKDYPEFGAALQDALNEALARFRKELPAAAAPGLPDGAATREDIEAVRAELAVEVRHAGWQNTVRTPGFQGWLQTQPAEVRALAATPGPEAAIRLLDLHKEASSKTTAQRTQRQAAAAAIPMGRAGAVRAKPTDQMTREELWKHLDAVDAQKG